MNKYLDTYINDNFSGMEEFMNDENRKSISDSVEYKVYELSCIINELKSDIKKSLYKGRKI